MHVKIPEEMTPYIAEGTTARLVVGTFSMLPAEQIGSQTIRNWMQFRLADAPPEADDDQVIMGTLNPTTITQGNRLVMLVVDHPVKGKPVNGSAVVACWVPVGDNHRHIIESEDYALGRWLGQGVGAKKHRALLWWTVLGVSISCSMPPIGIVIVPLLIARHRKFKDGRIKGFLDTTDGRNMVYKWVSRLIREGDFQRAYDRFYNDTSQEQPRL